MSEEKLYLEEDEDLLKELESIEIISSTEAFEEQKKKVQSIQIKATLRTRKTFVDFDKSTTRFSVILGVFALIQVVVALFQFVLQGADS